MIDRFVRKALGASLTTVILASPMFSQTKWAVVNGETITEDQVRKAAAEDLQSLELRKAQTEAGFKRDEHAIYERSLRNIVDNKLLSAEAKKRSIEVEALLRTEVESKLIPPTDKDVTDFYEANKARISGGGSDVMQQIQTYLTQRRRDDAYTAFTNKLRIDYKVEDDLEPLRWQIATQGFPTMGPSTAPVTIIEFSDFECPFCGQQFPIMKKIETDFNGRIRVVFRQMPLTNLHPHAQKAAEASLCANDQKKFWELHDAMFQDNKNLDVNALKQKAAALKLDSQAFNACLDSSKYADAVTNDVHEGVKLGISGTPVMFVNGRYLSGVQPYEDIAKIIDEEIQRAKK